MTSIVGFGGRLWLELLDVLAYFKKSEGLAPSGDIMVDAGTHGATGPLGVSVRAPVITARKNSSTGVAAGFRSRLQRP